MITILWIYQKFYQGQEPQGVHERGQWLLKLYVEATRLLEPKENETPEEKALREMYEAERRELYRKWDAGDPEVRQLWLETANGAWKSFTISSACSISTWMSGSSKARWTSLPSRSSKS